MRFLRKNNVKKTVLVISDFHLGAGAFVNGRRNNLEDFHFDKEFVDFLDYYSSGDYSGRNVELVINGDFFDFLAVPYVNYFDDEFWSEEAALAKIKLILDAHQEVMQALHNFLKDKKKHITYIIGNHDAELVFESVRNEVLNVFSDETKDKFKFLIDGEDYIPTNGVVIQHGHEYELAHSYDTQNSIVEDEEGRRHFIPPWGSYYVTRVINKYKEERSYVNAVRPIHIMLLNGLLYDPLFTLRFMFSNVYYMLMVRVMFMAKNIKKLSELFKHVAQELELFQDYEEMTKGFFTANKDIHTLIVGHTHEPIYRANPDGTTFINTGTWTKMIHLDLTRKNQQYALTYAKIDVFDVKDNKDQKLASESSLNIWKGTSKLPFVEYY